MVTQSLDSMSKPDDPRGIYILTSGFFSESHDA